MRLAAAIRTQKPDVARLQGLSNFQLQRRGATGTHIRPKRDRKERAGLLTGDHDGHFRPACGRKRKVLFFYLLVREFTQSER